MATIFHDLCHVFEGKTHIRGKICAKMCDLCAVFWPDSHIRGKICVKMNFGCQASFSRVEPRETHVPTTNMVKF